MTPENLRILLTLVRETSPLTLVSIGLGDGHAAAPIIHELKGTSRPTHFLVETTDSEEYRMISSLQIAAEELSKIGRPFRILQSDPEAHTAHFKDGEVDLLHIHYPSISDTNTAKLQQLIAAWTNKVLGLIVVTGFPYDTKYKRPRNTTWTHCAIKIYPESVLILSRT
jgi:hypothetical protein